MEEDNDDVQYEILNIETLDGDTLTDLTSTLSLTPAVPTTIFYYRQQHQHTAPILQVKNLNKTTTEKEKVARVTINNNKSDSSSTFSCFRCSSTENNDNLVHLKVENCTFHYLADRCSRQLYGSTNLTNKDEEATNICCSCPTHLLMDKWTTIKTNIEQTEEQTTTSEEDEESEYSTNSISSNCEKQDDENLLYEKQHLEEKTVLINNNNNNHSNNEDNKLDLLAIVKIKKKNKLNEQNNDPIIHQTSKCSPMKMVSQQKQQQNSNQNHNLFILNLFSKKLLFPVILLLSIIALVLLHNGSLHTRKTPTPKKFFTTNNPFITEFEFGQLKELWSRLVQNEIAFIMFYAPWDSDCIRARNEIEVVANHYGQQIFFGAINCWWPEGECKKYQTIKRFPHFVAYIRSEGEIEYKGPVLASYIIPFLDNVMNPLIPVQNEGELLDLRAQHDAVVLGYFDFNQSPNQPGYRSYLTTAIKALTNDPWRTVVYTVVTNSRTAIKLKIDPQKEASLVIYVGNTSEHFTAKFSKPFTLLSWIYSRSELANTIKWMNPSGVKSTLIADYIRKEPTFILFTPRSFLLGISPYYDLLREIVLEYYNCDNSPNIRSLIHRNILRRRLLEERLSELEERCHELLDKEEITNENEKTNKRFNDNIDTCCHTQTVKWRSFGGARHGMTKRCLCTSCVHISLPKCPAKCSHFDCLSTASRFLDEFDPNYVNNTAVYCNQIKNSYQPKYTPYYKIVTTCSGNLQESHSDELWGRENVWATDEKINRMIQEFETQHCRKLKLGMNYTDLNFPETSENRKSNIRANFTGLACRSNKTLKFMAFDSLLYQAFAESLGIDVFNVPHSTIALIIDPTKESVHVLNHEILFQDLDLNEESAKNELNAPKNSYSKNSLIEFVKNFTDGTLPRFLRNQMSSGICDFKQMISQDRNRSVICVPELNTVTFVNLVLGRSLDQRTSSPSLVVYPRKFMEKDIVVMYYAPWCGFCSSIAHVYLNIARFFAFSDDIIFARINGDANDLPWEYTVDRYPTIIFFPARKRSNSITYPPNKLIDKIGLYEFIMDHAQLSVKIQMVVARCQQSCLQRSMISNYFHRQSTIRTINHFLKSFILCKNKLTDIQTQKLSTDSKSKESKRLTDKLNQVNRHLNYIRLQLRKLRKDQQKQSLLSQFILMKITHLLQSDFDYGKFDQQFHLLLKNNDKKKMPTKKINPKNSGNSQQKQKELSSRKIVKLKKRKDEL